MVARAIITIIIDKISDDEAVNIKKQIQDLLKDLPGVGVAVNIQGT